MDKNEELLLQMVKEKQASDKRLLKLEWLIGALSLIIAFVPIIIANTVPMEEWLRMVLCFSGLPPFLVSCLVMMRIEQVAGYYKCKHCNHRYVPTYNDLTMAMHVGRTRYMKCPECGNRSWQKKVISKE